MSIPIKFFELSYILVFCLFSSITCFHCNTLAHTPTTVQLKNWPDYTDTEKVVLVKRWSENEVSVITGALKGRNEMPDYVARIRHRYRGGSGRGVGTGFDLRGIPFVDQDLSGVILSGYILQGADFWRSNLSTAFLFGADLQGASLYEVQMYEVDLSFAELQYSFLKGANLEQLKLYGTKLRKAILTEANLRNADLTDAELQGTNLTKAILENTNLYGAHFDSTYLWQVNLGEAKNIRYIVWGDSLDRRYVIGEEKVADSTKLDDDFRKTEITYRDLKAFYKKELMDDVASELHFRENQVITKRYIRTIRQPFNCLWGIFRFLFLKLTYGYGSRPNWLLWYSLVVVVLFSLIFVFLTLIPWTKSGIYLVQLKRSADIEELVTFRKGLLFLDCFYFSLLSFCTFGYGALQPRQWLQLFRLQPVEFKPVRWARICVGIEAALGIWIFALLVTVLFGR